jgi:hypothetical protein
MGTKILSNDSGAIASEMVAIAAQTESALYPMRGKPKQYRKKYDPAMVPKNTPKKLPSSDLCDENGNR